MKDKNRTVVRVSEYAIVRYLERAKGFNFSKIREHLRKSAQGMIDAGASSVTVDGVDLCIKDGIIYTVKDNRPMNRRGGRVGPDVEI